jgi:hypothetical protein
VLGLPILVMVHRFCIRRFPSLNIIPVMMDIRIVNVGKDEN